MYTFLTIISIPILILIRILTRKFSINKELKEFWNFNMEILEKYVQRNENPIFYENRLFLWKINYEDVRNALSCQIGEDQDIINPSGARFHIYEKWKKEQDAFEDAVPEEIRKKYQQLIEKHILHDGQKFLRRISSSFLKKECLEWSYPLFLIKSNNKNKQFRIFLKKHSEFEESVVGSEFNVAIDFIKNWDLNLELIKRRGYTTGKYFKSTSVNISNPRTILKIYKKLEISGLNFTLLHLTYGLRQPLFNNAIENCSLIKYVIIIYHSLLSNGYYSENQMHKDWHGKENHNLWTMVNEKTNENLLQSHKLNYEELINKNKSDFSRFFLPDNIKENMNIWINSWNNMVESEISNINNSIIQLSNTGININKKKYSKEEINQLISILKVYDEDLIWNFDTGLKFKNDFFKILKSYIK